MRVFVVREGEPVSLPDVLRKMGEDADAVREGRVFLGRKRVQDAHIRLTPGDEISVAKKKARSPAESRGAAIGDAEILYEHRGIVAANKPAGVPTIADHGGTEGSLVAMVARALSRSSSRVHPTSRLDRGVSGVVLFALDEVARTRLLRAREEHRYERRYVALTSRAPTPDRGTWDAPIGRAKDPMLRRVNGKDATHAETRYATVATSEIAAMLALAPITGRTHQLRVHAAHAGTPLLGDADYGRSANVTLPTGEIVALTRVALHCARVRLLFDADTVVVSARVPSALQEVGKKLALSEAAWEESVICTL